MIAGERLIRLARAPSASRAAGAYARREAGEVLSAADVVAADELEATLEAMFLMAAVDGQVRAQEIAQLAGSMNALLDVRATGRGAATQDAAQAEDGDVDGLLVRLATCLERDGWTARVAAVAARLLTPEARAFAFRLAAGVAFVDDHVAHAEAAALRALAAALGLDARETSHIVQDVHEALFEG